MFRVISSWTKLGFCVTWQGISCNLLDRTHIGVTVIVGHVFCWARNLPVLSGLGPYSISSNMTWLMCIGVTFLWGCFITEAWRIGLLCILTVGVLLFHVCGCHFMGLLICIGLILPLCDVTVLSPFDWVNLCLWLLCMSFIEGKKVSNARLEHFKECIKMF